MRKADPTLHEERRSQILAAALACFRRKGFAATTTAAICAEAGMSPGHLFHYFKNKDDIIGALAEADQAQAGAACAWLEQQNDLTAALLAAADETQDIGAFSIDGGLAFELYAEAGRNPRVLAAVQRNYGSVHQALLAAVRRGQADGSIDPALDPKGAATLVTAIFDGLAIAGLSAADFDAAAVGRVLPYLFERFLRPGQAPTARPGRARTRKNVS
jgi:TetR/AcrR family transcriptional regulator, repressor for uid operon